MWTEQVINQSEWCVLATSLATFRSAQCFVPIRLHNVSLWKELRVQQSNISPRVSSSPDAGGCRSIWPDPAQLFWPGQDGLHDGVCSRNGSRSHVWHVFLSQVSLNSKTVVLLQKLQMSDLVSIKISCFRASKNQLISNNCPKTF